MTSPADAAQVISFRDVPRRRGGNDVIEVDVDEVARWLDAGEAVLIDVRETHEFEDERIPGALLLPLSAFRAEHFPDIPGKTVVLHCAAGRRSEVAGRRLLEFGFPEAVHMRGGLAAWKSAGLPVIR